MEFHPRAEHVWVSLTAVWGDQAVPGLLLAWRRNRKGAWEGWVVSVQPGMPAHGDGPYVTQRWVDASAIKPARPGG